MIGMEDVIQRYGIKKALQKTKVAVSNINTEDIDEFNHYSLEGEEKRKKRTSSVLKRNLKRAISNQEFRNDDSFGHVHGPECYLKGSNCPNPPNISEEDSPSKVGLFLSSTSLFSAQSLTFIQDQTKAFSLKSDLFYSPFHDNRILFSLPKSVTPKVKFSLKGLGYGLSVYSAIDNEYDYRSNEISEKERWYNHSLNTIGTAFPFAGVGIAAGDYLGRTYNKEITHAIVTEGTTTNNTVSTMLEMIGIPSSKKVHDEWNKNGGPFLYEWFVKD